MKLRNILPAAIGISLGVFAFSASAQTTANAKTSAGASQSKTATAPGMHKHHATAHHRSHAAHDRMAVASMAGKKDTAYRAALRNCVAGPAGQRESCLDKAIARFGRS